MDGQEILRQMGYTNCILSHGIAQTYHIQARQYGCHFKNDIWKCCVLYENCVLIWISLKYIPEASNEQ